MKNKMKGQQNIRRPLPVRFMAIVMAVVMVFSVVYVNNRWGVVKADDPIEITDSTFVNFLPTSVTGINDQRYKVKVPSDGTYSVVFNTFPTYTQDDTINPVTMYLNSDNKYQSEKPSEDAEYTNLYYKTTLAWSSDSAKVGDTIYYKRNYTYYSDDSGADDKIVSNIVDADKSSDIFVVAFETESFGENDITYDASAKSVSDVSRETNTDTETGVTTYYYGTVSYSYGEKNGQSLSQTNADVAAIYSSLQENETKSMTITKTANITIGENTYPLATSSGYDISIKKNEKIVDAMSATQNDTAIGTLNSDKLTIDGANPTQPINVTITTDSNLSNGITITPETVGTYTAPAVTGPTYGGTTHTFVIPAPSGSDYLSGITRYTVAVNDNDEVTDTYTVDVTYTNSAPRIEVQTAEGSDYHYGGVLYYKKQSVKLCVEGSVGADSGATIANYTLFKAGDDGTYPAIGTRVEPFADDPTIADITVPLTPDKIEKYKFGITSSYNQSSIANDELKVCYDASGPTISNVSVSNINKPSSENPYSDSIDNPSASATFTNGISKRDAATLTITTDDISGIKTINQVEGEGESATKTEITTSYDSTTHKFSVAIPAVTDQTASDYSNYDPKTYTFEIIDNVGHVTTFAITVKFVDESITISRKIVKHVAGEEGSEGTDTDYNFYTGTTETPTNPFLLWEGDYKTTTTGRDFDIVYTVVTDLSVPLSSAKFNHKIGGEAQTEKTLTLPTPVPSDGKNTYTFRVSAFDATSSKTYTEMDLSLENVNGTKATDSISIINVDSSAPNTTHIAQQGTSSLDTTKWYKADLIIAFNVGETGTEPKSGIKSVTAKSGITGSITEESGVYLATVTPSNDTTGTAVSFEVEDNAGNVFTDSYTLKVDNTIPKTGLTISGVDASTYVPDETSATIQDLKTNPDISYAPDDTLSGVDTTAANKPVGTISDGTITADLKTTSTNLSTYITDEGFATGEDVVYTVKVTVKDVSGNEKTDIKKFRVDTTDPESGLTVVTQPTKKISPYYNTSVQIDFTAEDTRLYDGGFSVTDNGTNVTGACGFTINGTSATGTYNVPVTQQGEHIIKYVVTDTSGKATAEKTARVIIDTTPPDVKTLLNGNEYTSANSYNKSVTTGITYDDNLGKDDNDITATIVRDIPGGGQTTSTKKGLGPHSISEDGKYTVTYKVVDKAGNSTTTDPIGFTVDNTAPVHNLYVTTANPSKVEDYPNNYINGVGKWQSSHEAYRYGQFYNGDVTVELNYFDYNLDWVYVTDNGEEISPSWTKNGAFGKATYTFTSEGYHDVQIWSKDLSGNETNDTVLGKRVRFTIDRSAPSITTYLNSSLYSEGSGTRYLNTNGSLNVSVSEGNKDTYDLTRSYKVTPPGGTSKTYEDKVDEGTENYSEEADYEVSYVAVDKAGNKSATRNVYFRVDRTAPKLTINGPGSSSNASSTSVSFNVQESFYWDMTSCTVKIYKKVDGSGEVLEKTLDMNPSSANYSQSYSFVDDAEYRMEFTAEDKCGNKSQTDYTFIKDGNAPSILLSGVKNYDKTDKNVELTITIEEAFYTSNRVTLSGTRTDIDGKSHKIDFDDFATNRTKISQLQQMFKEDGIYDITVTSTDKAGNSSSKTVHFTIDTTKPVIGDLSKYDGVKLNKFKWDVDLDELVKDLTVCDIKLYLDGALYDGTSDIEDGSHVLKVEATDELGHSSSKEVTFVLDSKAPNIIVMNVEEGDNLLESTDITVTVELDEDSLDTVTLNDKAINIANNEGKITVNEKGDYVLNATAHDEAGNVSSVEIKFSYGKQTNLLFIGIIAGAAILLLLLLLVFLRRRRNDN